MSDTIPLIPSIRDGLREAAQLGTLIPFVGAGASVLAGCPTWDKLADGALGHFITLGKRSYAQIEQIKYLNPRVKISLAKAFEDEHESRIDFKNLLHPEGCVSLDGIKLYKSLSKLGNIFVTTNYDEWLDEEITDTVLSVGTGPPPKIPVANRKRRVIYKPEEMIPSCLNEPNTVIHLHGSLRDPDNMVLTTQDYIRLYANDRPLGDITKENRVLTFLEYLFKHKTVLFVGYGLNELEILEYVILKARRLRGAKPLEAKHFILQGYFSHEQELVRSMKRYYLNECGIELIPFSRDLKDRRQLLDVLEDFARSLPASEPMVLKEFEEMEDLLDA